MARNRNRNTAGSPAAEAPASPAAEAPAEAPASPAAEAPSAAAAPAPLPLAAVVSNLTSGAPSAIVVGDILRPLTDAQRRALLADAAPALLAAGVTPDALGALIVTLTAGATAADGPPLVDVSDGLAALALLIVAAVDCGALVGDQPRATSPAGKLLAAARRCEAPADASALLAAMGIGAAGTSARRTSANGEPRQRQYRGAGRQAERLIGEVVLTPNGGTVTTADGRVWAATAADGTDRGTATSISTAANLAQGPAANGRKASLNGWRDCHAADGLSADAISRGAHEPQGEAEAPAQ